MGGVRGGERRLACLVGYVCSPTAPSHSRRPHAHVQRRVNTRRHLNHHWGAAAKSSIAVGIVIIPASAIVIMSRPPIKGSALSRASPMLDMIRHMDGIIHFARNHHACRAVVRMSTADWNHIQWRIVCLWMSADWGYRRGKIGSQTLLMLRATQLSSSHLQRTQCRCPTIRERLHMCLSD